MGTIQIRLFGKLHVSLESHSLQLPGGYKERELLVYLLLHRERQHRREVLATLFWDHSTTSQSLKYLRNTIWKLQNTFASDAGIDNIILVDGEWIWLNRDIDISLDVASLEQAFDHVAGRAGHTLSDKSVEALDDVVQLYQGELLEGWYQDWCVFERERLRGTYLGLLDKLMAYCEAHNQYERGIEYGTRILRPDRARERTHRRLMRLYYLAGDRTAALRQFEMCVAALREELDVGPGQRTQALYTRIRQDLPHRRRDGPALVEAGTSAEYSSRSEDLLAQLQQLQQTLDTSQKQLQAISRVVEHLLNGNSS